MGAALDVLHASKWAMGCGRLRDAEAGYRWLLDLRPWPGELAGVAREDIALALAEVLLDCADGEGFLVVHRSWASASGATWWKWDALAAQRCTDMGLLSDARKRWGALIAAARLAGDPWAASRARAQHAMTLLLLNRLDEAWDDPAFLAFDGAGAEEDAAWTGWTSARRWGGGRGRTPATTEAILEREGPGPPVRAAERDGAGLWEAPPRDPRARVWLARLANRTLVALDQGYTDAARALVAAVEGPLALPLDPSLAARVAWLRGLICWAEGDLTRAEHELAAACDGALGGGLLLDAWNAARAATLVAASLGRSPNPWRTTERDLRDKIVGLLTPEDRVFFLANRADAVDQTVVDELARAADPGEALTALHAIQGTRWGATEEREPHERRPKRVGKTSLSTRIWQWIGLRSGFAEEPLDLAWIPADAAVLVQVVVDGEVAMFVTTRERCRVIRVRCARVELARRVEAAVREVYDAGRPWSAPAIGSALTELADTVGVAAITRELGPSVNRVFLMPDGPCVQAPWAALPFEGAPWVARMEIGTLSVLRKARSSWRPAIERGVHGVAVTRGEPRPLPLTAHDLSAISERGWSVTRLENPTREDLARSLAEACAAHLACHGTFDGDDPLSSGLHVDGALLDLDAISRLDLRRLALTVLAACWTGEVTQLPGRELFGVPISLHAAGVGAVLAPSWPVPDQAGAGVARALWGHMRSSDAVGALAAMQRAAWPSRRPLLWAGWRAWVDGVG